MAEEPKDINQVGNEKVLDVLSAMSKTLDSINRNIGNMGEISGGGSAKGTASTPEGARLNTDPEESGGRRTSGSLVSIAGRGASAYGRKIQERREAEGEKTGVSLPPNSAERRAKSAGGFLEKAGSQYIPQGKALAQTVSRAANAAGRLSSDFTRQGEIQGVSGGGSDISIGGVGIRNPFNAAAQVGMKMKAATISDSLGAGITGSQATNIQNQLIDRGHNFGTSNYDKMHDAMVGLTKTNAAMGQDPMSYDILDKTTRLGGGSIEDFKKTMATIPDAAKAAGVSLKQMTSDVNAAGDAAKKTGGTYNQGAQASADLTNVTGLAGPVAQHIQEGGFYKATAMQQTGLLPWQMGQMSGDQKTKAMYGTMDQLYKQMGPAPKDKTSVDAAGFKHVQSGQEQRDADIALMMGESVETVAKMRRDKRKVMASSAANEGFSGYDQQVSAINSSGMGEEAKKAKIQALSASGGKGTFGALEKQMHSAGFTREQIAQVSKAGGGDDMTGSAADLAKRASSRTSKFKEILGKQTAKANEQGEKGNVMVTLSEDAKKYLSIVGDPTGDAKTQAGAGNGTVVSGQMQPAPAYK